MGFSLGSSALKSVGKIAGAAIGGSIGGPAGAVLGSSIGGMIGVSPERQAKRDYNYQYQKALQAWNLQNSYNEPIAQMARLKAAGLNPMLVYGSGNVTGNASSSIDLPTLSSTDLNSPSAGFSNVVGEMASNSFRQNMQEQRIAAQQALSNNELDNQIKQAKLEYLQLRNKGLTTGSGTVKPGAYIDEDTTVEEIMSNPNLTVQEKKAQVSLLNALKEKPQGFSTDPLSYIGRVFGGAYNAGRKGGAWLRKKMAERGYNVEAGYLPYK